MKNTFYILSFIMEEPINSYTGTSNPIKNGVLVTNNMIKIGQCKGKFRKNDYNRTYGHNYKIEKEWSLDLDILDLKDLENNIKSKFYDNAVFSPRGRQTEYFLTEKNLLSDIKKYIEEEIQSCKLSEEYVSVEIECEPHEDDVYVRSDRPITNGCADHNVRRWEWIGKEGKTYNQINAPNSKYRIFTAEGVITFHQNTSSIKPHLRYDLKGGWIKESHE